MNERLKVDERATRSGRRLYSVKPCTVPGSPRIIENIPTVDWPEFTNIYSVVDYDFTRKHGFLALVRITLVL